MGIKYSKYIKQPKETKTYFTFNSRERITSTERRRKEDKSFVLKIRTEDHDLANALESLLDRIETGRESRADSTESRRGIGAQFYNILRSKRIKPYNII